MTAFPEPGTLPADDREDILAPNDYSAAATIPPDSEGPILDEEAALRPATAPSSMGGGFRLSIQPEMPSQPAREVRPAARPKTPHDVMDAEADEATIKWFRHFTSLGSKTAWHVKRVGPAYDSMGNPVNCGVYPNVIPGLMSPKAIYDRLGGGEYMVAVASSSGNEDELRWMGPVVILGDPLRQIDLDSRRPQNQPAGWPHFGGTGDFGPGGGGFDGPGGPNEQMVEQYDAERGCKILVPASSLQRQRMDPIVMRLLEENKRLQQQMADFMKQTADKASAPAQQQQDSPFRFLMEAEKERLAADRARYDYELRIKQEEAKAAKEQALRDAEEKSRQRQHELSLAKEQLDRERESAKAERERAERKEETFQRFLLETVTKKGSDDPLKGVAGILAIAKDLSNVLTGGGGEPATVMERLMEKAGTALEKLAPALEEPLRKLLNRMADGQARMLPNGQQQPRPTPAPAAAPKAPAPTAEDLNAMVQGITNLVELLGIVLDGKHAPEDAWEKVKDMIPDRIKQQVTTLKNADELVTGLQKMAAHPLLTEKKPELERLAALAGGTARELAERFVAAASGKPRLAAPAAAPEPPPPANLAQANFPENGGTIA